MKNESVLRFDAQMINALSKSAKDSPRQRANKNIHPHYQDAVQRLFISMCPDSYVRPHRHTQDYKWEFFMVVSGRLDILLFEEDGTLTERIPLEAGGETFGVEIPPNTWHATVCYEPVTFVEVKQGPYEITEDKNFALWSPPEGDNRVPAFLQTLKTAEVGQLLSMPESASV
ncbi:WbuC family cupin fold metalloprotein [Alteromonas sp. KUL49]|uniref:WbuC family cupin fold metalloprotein n=1 Tax=Alteromonas sp. KUL49 TaxID=2480798 RepID=UPI0010FFBD11|nr:WbuC family cupin fold metalloprotein [Alteromonas sp. KUL49]GEA10551.1 hypothetical protein KUL49_09260 [Alteromonas sp. KUL49]